MGGRCSRPCVFPPPPQRSQATLGRSCHTRIRQKNLRPGAGRRRPVLWPGLVQAGRIWGENFMTVNDFSEFYRGIHKKDPFPWQERLAKQDANTREIPRTLSLPTASRKTTLLGIYE